MNTCAWFALAGFAAGLVCAALVVLSAIFWQWRGARDFTDDDNGGGFGI